MTTLRFPAVLAFTLVLTACSGNSEPPAPHSTTSTAGDHTSSSAGLPVGDIARGEALANGPGSTGQSCVSCHGKDGNAPIDPTYPKLGGQYADYLAHALQRYRDGRREHALMQPQAVKLTDQQIADVSAYFGSRPGQLVDLAGK